MNINEDNSSSTSGGIKSKFSERLKKIARNKRKKPIIDEVEKNRKDVRVVFKPFLIISSLFYGAVNQENKCYENENTVSQKALSIENGGIINKEHFKDGDNKKQKMLIKNNNTMFNIDKINKNNYDVVNSNQTIISEDISFEEIALCENKIERLQKEVISLIKKRLVKTMNELEILHSDFYILKLETGDETYLEECREKIKEAKKLLSKIKSLKEKYDYLKDNMDFDNLLEIKDDVLINKIIELKDVCEKEDIKKTIKDYKILEEYKSLYLKIDKLEEETLKYDRYKKEKEEELKKRDIDFNKLKNEYLNKELLNEHYDKFLIEQEELLKELNENIMKIDSHEQVNYKIKGFEVLLGNSFRYLGLLIASPFKGIFPSIAAQTVITKNILDNLYNNLSWEKETKLVYEAIDFSKTINTAINDIDNMSNLIDVTLNDVKRLKEKYKKDFAKYQTSFYEYREVIKKINKMENSILNNKIKIELLKENMKEKERENDNKMKLVKKLNCSTNN